MMQRGLLGVSLPTLAGLQRLAIGPRGLFVLSPVLLLAGPGLAAMFRRSDLRLEFWVFTGIAAGFLIGPAGFFDPLGGGGPGPRFSIPALPFLAASIGLLARRWRIAFAILGGASMAIMLIVTAVNPQAPVSVANPIVDYWLPGLLSRQVVMTTAFLRFGVRNAASLLLLAGVLAIGGLGWIASCRLAACRFLPASSSGPTRQRLWWSVLGVCAVAALIAYLAIAFPINLLQPFSVPSTMIGLRP
jgi:hypothetical protein